MSKIVVTVQLLLLIILTSCGLSYTANYDMLNRIGYVEDISAYKENINYKSLGKVYAEKSRIFMNINTGEEITKSINDLLTKDVQNKVILMDGNAITDISTNAYFSPSVCCLPGITYIKISGAALVIADNIGLKNNDLSLTADVPKIPANKTEAKTEVIKKDNDEKKESNNNQINKQEKIVKNKEPIENKIVETKIALDSKVVLPKPIKITTPVYPKIKYPNENKKVLAQILVSDQGKPVSVQYVINPGQVYVDEVANVLSEFEFEPGTINGVASNLKMNIFFIFKKDGKVEVKY